MNLAQQAIDDFARVTTDTNEFAKAAVYTKYSDGISIDVSVISEDLQFFNSKSEGRLVGDNGVVYINLPFAPEQYDVLLIGAEKWVVESFSVNHGGYRLIVEKDTVSTRKHTKSRFR